MDLSRADETGDESDDGFGALQVGPKSQNRNPKP